MYSVYYLHGVESKNTDRVFFIQLALCGFYLVRNGRTPDTVRCFLCNVELSSWSKSSDAKKRHAKASPSCAWVVLQYPDGSHSLEITDDTLPRSQEMRTARLWTFSKNAYWPPASYNKNQLPAQSKVSFCCALLLDTKLTDLFL